MIKYLFIPLYLSFLSSFSQNKDDFSDQLAIKFETKEKTGRIYISLFDSEEHFLKKPFKTAVVNLKNRINAVKMENIKQKSFAVATFIDLNNNGKLDTNFMGIPKEPYGFSNNAKGLFGPPSFKKSKVTLSEDHKNLMSIKMTQ